MSIAGRGVLWIGLYVAVAVLPLVFAVMGEGTGGRDLITEFSVALGFVGLSMMGLQYVLVARVTTVTAPFGEDAVLIFHRHMATVATAFILAHPVLLFFTDTDMLALLTFWDAPWRARLGLTSVVCLLVVMATSWWRKRLRLRYEHWQVVHGVLSTLAVLTALGHVGLVGHYVDTPWKWALWATMTACFLGLLGWIRLIQPWRRRRRPWVVDAVTPEAGDVTTLTLRPVGHPGITFAPGQFVWIMVDRSPFALTQHPFSLSSSAEPAEDPASQDGRIEVSIKALGDFTGTVADIQPGTRVYVDGPHGVFSPDLNEGPGFVLIAGGIGITPQISILRTLADRGDRRPCLLVYATRDLEQATFAEELAELCGRLDLKVVHVLEKPPEGWEGERGHVDEEMLRRHLPARFQRQQYFVCGPPRMLDAVEELLAGLGIPGDRIHTERFSFV